MKKMIKKLAITLCTLVCGISLFVIAVFILIFGIYNSTHQVKRYKVLNEDIDFGDFALVLPSFKSVQIANKFS